METGSDHSKKIYLIIILLVPLAVAVLYPVTGLNTDIKWKFFMMLVKGYSRFFIALIIYLLIVYLAIRILRNFR